MYGARFGLRDFVIDDIRRVTAQDLPAEIDLVTASFPCIDLSLAGNRAGVAGRVRHRRLGWGNRQQAASYTPIRFAPTADNGMILVNQSVHKVENVLRKC